MGSPGCLGAGGCRLDEYVLLPQEKEGGRVDGEEEEEEEKRKGLANRDEEDSKKQDKEETLDNTKKAGAEKKGKTRG